VTLGEREKTFIKLNHGAKLVSETELVRLITARLGYLKAHSKCLGGASVRRTSDCTC